MIPETRHSKYHNRKTTIDNITFDSAKEARRYIELKLLKRAGKITNFFVHPVFELEVNGRIIGKYIADFEYVENGKYIIEDVKSNPTRTPLYIYKKKLLKAIYGYDIKEV